MFRTVCKNFTPPPALDSPRNFQCRNQVQILGQHCPSNSQHNGPQKQKHETDDPAPPPATIAALPDVKVVVRGGIGGRGRHGRTSQQKASVRTRGYRAYGCPRVNSIDCGVCQHHSRRVLRRRARCSTASPRFAAGREKRRRRGVSFAAWGMGLCLHPYIPRGTSDRPKVPQQRDRCDSGNNDE